MRSLGGQREQADGREVGGDPGDHQQVEDLVVAQDRRLSRIVIVGSDVVLEDRGTHPLKMWRVHGAVRRRAALNSTLGKDMPARVNERRRIRTWPAPENGGDPDF
jgi:hypothetical protein